MNIIEINKLSHIYSNGTLALDGIDFVIKRGEFTVIAGCNGSGKTTLLRHLNGLLFPNCGSVTVDGVNVSGDPARARRIVGMVFQDADTQIVGETVREDVAFGPENLSLDREEIEQRVNDALRITGLEHLAGARPHLLSGGEKRRLAIAGVLAMKTEVLALDEPFSNLDYPGTLQVLKQIVELHKMGRTIVLTTHDLEKVIAHAGRLIIMKNGRIAREGAPELILPDAEIFGIKEPYFSRMGLGMISWLN